MPFTALGLAPALQRAAHALGWQHPTPVQAATIAPLLAGQDVWVQAGTGAGKTAAFALPLLQAWLNGRPEAPRPVEGLVLVPTRELALQVGGVLRELGDHLPGLLKVAVVFGGVSINPQMMGLRGGADVVVATPGRLLDLVRHNALRLDRVRRLVLDEADRLLALGFAEELADIHALLPEARQTVLCSATFPPPVKALMADWLREPHEVRLANVVATQPDITQRALRVDTPHRTTLLKHLLAQLRTEQPHDARAMVFVATQHATEHVSAKLRQAGIHAAAFHGSLSHGARTGALADFKNGQLQVLVATDMAARGLHVDGLPMVVNYDLPRATEDYTHRIGRTGRAGHSGQAISFLATLQDEAHLRLIEKRQGATVAREVWPGLEPVEPTLPAADPAAPEAATSHPALGTGLDPHGGIKGRRKSKKDKLREEAAAAAVRPAQAAEAPAFPGRPRRR